MLQVFACINLYTCSVCTVYKSRSACHYTVDCGRKFHISYSAPWRVLNLQEGNQVPVLNLHRCISLQWAWRYDTLPDYSVFLHADAPERLACTSKTRLCSDFVLRNYLAKCAFPFLLDMLLEMSRVGLARFFFRTLSVTQDLSQRATTGSCSGVRMEDAYSNGKTLLAKTDIHASCRVQLWVRWIRTTW